MYLLNFLEEMALHIYDKSPALNTGEFSVLVGFEKDYEANNAWRCLLRGEPLKLPPSRYTYINFVRKTGVGVVTTLQRITEARICSKQMLLTNFTPCNSIETFVAKVYFADTTKHYPSVEKTQLWLYVCGPNTNIVQDAHLVFTIHDNDTASQILAKNILYALHALKSANVPKDVRKIISDYCLAPPVNFQWSIRFAPPSIGGPLKKLKVF